MNQDFINKETVEVNKDLLDRMAISLWHQSYWKDEIKENFPHIDEMLVKYHKEREPTTKEKVKSFIVWPIFVGLLWAALQTGFGFLSGGVLLNPQHIIFMSLACAVLIGLPISFVMALSPRDRD